MTEAHQRYRMTDYYYGSEDSGSAVEETEDEATSPSESEEELEPEVETPSPPQIPPWKLAKLGKSSTAVLQSLMARQLGFPFYVRSSGYICSKRNEKMICRHLFNARSSGSSTSTANPLLVTLDGSEPMSQSPSKEVTSPTTSATVPPDLLTWRQVFIPLPQPTLRTSVTIEAGGTFWESQRHGPNAYGAGINLETGYILDRTSPIEFKCLARSEQVAGEIKETAVIHGGLSAIKSSCYYSTYLAELYHNGRFRIFDFGKRKWSEFMLHAPGNVRFADLTFDNTTGHMYIMSKNERRTRTIYVVSYPPWAILDVIHIDFQAKLEIFDSIICFKKTSLIELTTWDKMESLLELTDVRISDTQDVMSPPSGFYEKILRRKPPIIAKIDAEDAYFGFLDSLRPPLYFSRTATSIRICDLNVPKPVWESFVEFGEAKLSVFPDESKRALFSTYDASYVLTFKKNEETNAYEVETRHPFTLPQLRARPSPNFSLCKRSKRQQKKLERMSGPPARPPCYVHAICYSDIFDVIGVCIIDELTMHVILYDAVSLEILKKLPSLNLDAGPSSAVINNEENASSDSTQADMRLSFLSSISMAIHSTFLVVDMSYSKKEYSSDLFFLRLI